MYDEIYLEPDEEVTSAIEKIKKSKKKNIALFLPRNSVLGQSIVNLKLVFKETAAEGKEIALISPDITTRNLGERIGFGVFRSTKEIDFPKEVEGVKPKKDHGEERKKPETTEKEEMTEDETKDAAEDKELAAAGFTTQAVESASEDSAFFANKKLEEPTPPVKDAHPVKEYKSEPESKAKPEHVAASAAPSGGMIPTKGNLRFFRQKKHRAARIPLYIFLGLLVASGIAAAFMIPTATVKLTVKARPFNETIKALVDTQATAIDVDKGVLPGKAITIEQTTKSTAKATGKKDIGTKATGTVTLTNEWDSLPHTFAAGTKVRAKNGNEYVLTAEATVPGATSTISAGKTTITPGKKEASVQAAEASDKYNIAATTFTIPSLPAAQQEKIYATSAIAFTGGTSNVVTVVTQADIDKVAEAVKKQNQDEAIVKIKEQSGNVNLLDKAIQTTSQDVSTSVSADTQADSVEATVNGKFTAIVFSKDDQHQFLEKLLANKIPQGEKLVNQGEGVGLEAKSIDLNSATDKTLDVTMNVQAFTISNFDENAIKRSITGAAPANLTEVVKKKLPVEKAEATIKPSAWPRLPLLSSKIKFEYSYKAEEKK